MHRILVLAANPEDSSPLRLGREVGDIQEGLRRSRYRDQFDFVSEWAVGARALRRALLDHQPEFVHFSGHATEKGIALEDEFGATHIVDIDALAELFSHFAGHVRCVLLNACHSQLQAEAISRVIPYAIGMQGKIADEAAIEFSVGFYDAVGAGREIDDAFAIGCNAIHTAGLPGHSLPVLNHRLLDTSHSSPHSPLGRVGVSTEAAFHELLGFLAEQPKFELSPTVRHAVASLQSLTFTDLDSVPFELRVGNAAEVIAGARGSSSDQALSAWCSFWLAVCAFLAGRAEEAPAELKSAFLEAVGSLEETFPPPEWDARTNEFIESRPGPVSAMATATFFFSMADAGKALIVSWRAKRRLRVTRMPLLLRQIDRLATSYGLPANFSSPAETLRIAPFLAWADKHAR